MSREEIRGQFLDDIISLDELTILPSCATAVSAGIAPRRPMNRSARRLFLQPTILLP